MYIESLDAPDHIRKVLERLGYRELYPPQSEALKKGLLKNRNMIIASPTASGKTLIAAMLIINNIVTKGGKHIYLVPLKALASEKYGELKNVLDELSNITNTRYKLSISTSDYDKSGEELTNSDVIIATYEKMDSILRHNPSWISDIKTLVIDEAHLVGSYERGPVVENIVMRITSDVPSAQILLLSATISNHQDFSKWIEGDVVNTSWRPIPLIEGVLYDHEIYYPNGEIRGVDRITGSDPIADKAINTILEGGQVLIFTASRREAKSKAKKLSNLIRSRKTLLLSAKTIKQLRRLSNEILNTGERTKLSEELAKVVENGVAFHHAGLGLRHRSIIEENFKKGFIKVLTATPTLAAGVNLPSRTVIITYTTRRGFGGEGEAITVFDYKQMAGRAGRPQYDDYGEALLYTSSQWEIDHLLDEYINSAPEPIYSRLLEGENTEIAILSLLSGITGIREKLVEKYFERSLAFHQNSKRRMLQRINKAVERLINYSMVQRVDNGDSYLKITKLGRRVAQLYVLPSTGYHLYEYAIKNRGEEYNVFDLLFTIVNTKDMTKVSTRKRDLDKIFEYIVDYGVEHYLDALEDTFYLAYDEITQSAVLKTVCVLIDWITEKTEDEIMDKWGVEPGDLYNLYTTAEWLSYAASELSLIAGNKPISKYFDVLRVRLKYGVSEELIPLVNLPDIGRKRARILYNNGYRSIRDIRKATLQDLASLPGIGVKTARKLLEFTKKT